MPPQFKKVHIEVTNICNLKCSFCPEVIRDHQLIDIGLFRQIIEQVAPMAEQVALHLMGDPLVHPKFSELVEICHQHQSKIFLVTNGVLLKKISPQELLHPAFRQVNFSLHSFADNFPQKDPSEYLERIFSFTELAFAARPDLYINYRLWNLKDPRGSSALNQEMLDRITKRFSASVPKEIDVRKRKSHQLKNRLYLHFDTEFIWPALDLPVLGTRSTCYGLSSHFGVLVDGNVVPCCLDKEGSIPLGNIKDRRLAEILADPRAKRILAGFKAHQLTEDLCQRCQYIERFQRPTLEPAGELS